MCNTKETQDRYLSGTLLSKPTRSVFRGRSPCCLICAHGVSCRGGGGGISCGDNFVGKISFFNLVQNFPRGFFLRNLGNFLPFVPHQTSGFPSTLPL